MHNVEDGIDQIPGRQPLENKPLAEAIFELRWKLASHQAPRIAADSGFRIFLGKYCDRVKHDYPVMVDYPHRRFRRRSRLTKSGISSGEGRKIGL